MFVCCLFRLSKYACCMILGIISYTSLVRRRTILFYSLWLRKGIWTFQSFVRCMAVWVFINCISYFRGSLYIKSLLKLGSRRVVSSQVRANEYIVDVRLHRSVFFRAGAEFVETNRSGGKMRNILICFVQCMGCILFFVCFLI